MTVKNTFKECLEFENKTSDIVQNTLELFGLTKIYKVGYEDTIGKSLQRKGVDYIASIL